MYTGIILQTKIKSKVEHYLAIMCYEIDDIQHDLLRRGVVGPIYIIEHYPVINIKAECESRFLQRHQKASVCG